MVRRQRRTLLFPAHMLFSRLTPSVVRRLMRTYQYRDRVARIALGPPCRPALSFLSMAISGSAAGSKKNKQKKRGCGRSGMDGGGVECAPGTWQMLER